MIHLKDIAPEFAYLSNMGFREADSSYRRESFGDAMLVLSGPEFALRFIRDRGQVFVDVSLATGTPLVDWCSLDTLLGFIASTRGACSTDTSIAPDRLAELLHDKWHEVRQVLTSRELLPQLRQFMLDRSRAHASRVFPESGGEIN